jgi:sigma-B regulation protein RsbU (phosphoserine phosphatase)
LQAALRMELRTSLESSAGPSRRVSTALMVSDLNQQLHATTSAEKYATFYFALYDEKTGKLTYTNAGHLSPLLIRRGRMTRLDTNGTVVGAFPLSVYNESTLQMESGDLLVCYTDGITEPENEYGEMFGEDRLVEIVTRNADRDEDAIIAEVMASVHQWSGSDEQQDDMTMLLARKC